MILVFESTPAAILTQLQREIILRVPPSKQSWVGKVEFPPYQVETTHAGSLAFAPRVVILGDRHHSIRDLVVDTVTQCLGWTPSPHQQRVIHAGLTLKWKVPFHQFEVAYTESGIYSDATELSVL